MWASWQTKWPHVEFPLLCLWPREHAGASVPDSQWDEHEEERMEQLTVQGIKWL